MTILTPLEKGADRYAKEGHRTEQTRTHELAARTHQRLLARQARQPVSGRPDRKRPDRQHEERDRER